MCKSCNWVHGKFSYRTSTQEEEKSSICQWKGYSDPFDSWVPLTDLEAWISVSSILGDQLKTIVKTILSFLRIYEGWLLERVDVGKLQWSLIFNLLLQPGWLDYNHLCVFRKSLHQQEYKVLRNGLEAGMSKQQVLNLFNSQEALGNMSPLTTIEKFSGVRNGKIQADFYDDCQDIPDPSALDPAQKICCCWTIAF